MKFLQNIVKKYFKPHSEGELVTHIGIVGEWKRLENPIMSNKVTCLVCNGEQHYSPLIDPSKKDSHRVWLCANPLCSSMDIKNMSKATYALPTMQRAILWHVWCQINDVGDLHHQVKFESIEQSQNRIEAFRKFLVKPSHILYFQGEPGTGKTYASLGICEFFTRRNSSCLFFTQKQMLNRWLETFKEDCVSNFIDKVTHTELLVIDDFGTGEVSPGFMGFFLDLINTRMQWSNRGTIITTNLKDDKFAKFCGDPLIDRISTAPLFLFDKSSRRKQKIL